MTHVSPSTSNSGPNGTVAPAGEPCFAEVFGRSSSSPGTPLDCMRRECVECAGSCSEVERCLGDANSGICEIHQHLMARLATGRRAGALGAIKRECQSCMGSSLVAHREACPSESCPLWPYRFGISRGAAGRRGYSVEARHHG